MNRVTLLALALAALGPVSGFLASEAYQADHLPEPHAYSRSDVASLTALIDAQDDLLAYGRKKALTREKDVFRPKSKAEAGRVIALMGM